MCGPPDEEKTMEVHPATLWEAIADRVPSRLALIQGPVHRSWSQFEDRAARLAGGLLSQGVRQGSKVGQLLYNCPEFVESYFAALKVRAVPFNVNYRYTGPEIAYLLENADCDALIYHATLSDVVAKARALTERQLVLIEVDDGGHHLDDSLRYEDVIASADAAVRITRDPDDVTMIYTGGTTGMPKGVVSRVGPVLADLLVTVPPLGGHPAVAIDDVPAYTEELEASGNVLVSLPASPLMHNTGLGMGMAPALATGGTVVLLEKRTFDAGALWDTVAAEAVNSVVVVGDPFIRPMLTALDNGPERDLSCVRYISSSGAMFSTELKMRLLEHLPRVVIIDLIGSSEGTMGMSIATADHPVPTGQFRPYAGVILIDDEGRPIPPGSSQSGLVALPGGAERYYKDDAKSASTFRIIDGKRYTIPGDHATIEADGTLVLLGRGSACINTAGEKVFPEEVEEILKSFASIEDALVFGVDDERFGQTVAAVVARAPGDAQSVEDVLSAAREMIAAYKVPRSVVVVDVVPRTQVGKPDYPAARALFESGHSAT